MPSIDKAAESHYDAKWERLTAPCCPLHDYNECEDDDE